MKLSLEIIEELVKQIAGKDTVRLVPLLHKKRNISEFVLAEKLEVSINSVRNMIYRLCGYNLVSSMRKKDKKKGWYIYYWTLNPLRVRDLIISRKKKQLENLKKKLSQEEGTPFFICDNKCIRMEFNLAMEHDFRCPECDELMREDKLVNLSKIKEEITKIENELEEGYEIEIPKELKKRKKKKKKPKKKKRVKKKKLKKKPTKKISKRKVKKKKKSKKRK